ncbi:MAG: mannose-1-phosphate guanylyltransferase/mannose-6-phosphate isomerase [Burkholderiaceae bacterium]
MILQPVILSGGSGTRLWPMSREKYPKQLLSLTGGDTMLQATAMRLAGFVGAVPVSPTPIVVCNEEYRFLSAEQLRSAGASGGRILLEPFGRNTAPALTLAAMLAVSESDDALLLVMPADHVILDQARFHAAVDAAVGPALDGAMVTFGIVPDRPETGYGYLHVATSILGTDPDALATQPLLAFVEKPPLDVAKEYLAGGRHLWNSGIFLMKASVWLRALQHLAPEMHAACEVAMRSGAVDRDFVRIGRDAFAACPSDSIDYAVMEKLAGAADLGIPGIVVPLSAGWSDVGAWDAVWASSTHDADGNSVQGDAMLEDTRNSLVITEGRLVACLGLDDMIVIETPDAVLVARKDRTQDIKKIVNRLKAESRPHADNHRKVHRPWGYYDSIDNGPRFQVKRIVVKPGASLSLQMHHHRAEHWIVVSGTARVTRGEEVIMLAENQSTYIPLGTVHRLENPGKIDLEMIEVQSGTYLGEDDIVRLEDNYGRLHAVPGAQAA